MKAQTILTPLHAQIIRFLEHLEVERNVSRLTIRNYRHYLSRFADWFAAGGYEDIGQLNLDSLREFRLHLSRLENKRKDVLSKKTQAYHIIALRSFLKWLRKIDIESLAPEKIDLPKQEATVMHVLTGDQLEHLLSQPLISTPRGLRDKAILEVLFSTGLRVSELTKLDREQVDTVRREFGVLGKGRKTRVVFLSERAARNLDQYLSLRTDPYSPVFVRMRKKASPTNQESISYACGVEFVEDGEKVRLTPRSIERIVERYVKKAHLPFKITPHGLRHTFATDLLSHGAGLRDVQELLGHKNIATTQIYTHVTRPELKRIHEKFHGTEQGK